MVVNVLIALSSFGVASIRDAVTEAVLSIGLAVVRVVVDSRSKLETSRRQLRAEESKSRASKQTSKYQSIEALVVQQETAVEEFTRLSATIFNAVFAHRYKDSNESIRAHACARLGQWLLQDPARLFEDTYLKYLGWMCSDRSPAVRLEAASAISNLCEVHYPAVNNLTLFDLTVYIHIYYLC
jgi:cohesin complex subunit SA-1/2